mmetsp:Transcript_62964/g.150135  ORF Transcript_62964/g.150135 Transcript_62964/m.150135 type:complete len:319 (-) Transcript_62964:257-1213(-)
MPRRETREARGARRVSEVGRAVLHAHRRERRGAQPREEVHPRGVRGRVALEPLGRAEQRGREERLHVRRVAQEERDGRGVERGGALRGQRGGRVLVARRSELRRFGTEGRARLGPLVTTVENEKVVHAREGPRVLRGRGFRFLLPHLSHLVEFFLEALPVDDDVAALPRIPLQDRRIFDQLHHHLGERKPLSPLRRWRVQVLALTSMVIFFHGLGCALLHRGGRGGRLFWGSCGILVEQEVGALAVEGPRAASGGLLHPCARDWARARGGCTPRAYRRPACLLADVEPCDLEDVFEERPVLPGVGEVDDAMYRIWRDG